MKVAVEKRRNARKLTKLSKSLHWQSLREDMSSEEPLSKQSFKLYSSFNDSIKQNFIYLISNLSICVKSDLSWIDNSVSNLLTININFNNLCSDCSHVLYFERDHYDSDLASSTWLQVHESLCRRLCKPLCNAPSSRKVDSIRPVRLWHYHYPGYDIWHVVARLHLTLVHELLCRPDVSPGFLYPFARNLKSKCRKLWWAMIRLCKLLDNLLRTGTAWECNRLGNERGCLYGGPTFGERGGERINSYPAILCWHISAYRNRLKMNK